MNVVQIFLPLLESPAELAGAIMDPNFLGSWQQDHGVLLYWQSPPKDVIERIQQALVEVGLTVPSSSIRITEVPMEDWNARWASSVTPIQVGCRVCIRASWTSIPRDSSRDIELIIDPKQAFGTGHHDTTQLLIQWLEDLDWRQFPNVLDLGTGSGILAMVALRLGAQYALGIDIDLTAIQCAREYARENSFQDELELWCGQIYDYPDKPFDLILANIDRKTLLQMSTEFHHFVSQSTVLLLSGLLLENEGEVAQEFERLGWNYVASRKRGEWVALQFTRSQPPPLSSSG